MAQPEPFESVNPSYLRWLRRTALGVSALILVGVFALACTYVYLVPSLPTSESMHNIEMAVPLRVLTGDGQLIYRFGEERRIPLQYDDIPPLVREAVLAAEDDRFFEHGGVDWMGFARAAFKVVVSGSAVQGGSTITQQAARQLFLTLDKTLRRKLAELFLTWRMERDFTKEQILSLYLNKIYFGERAYGIAAAAEIYYNTKVDELSVAQVATLAGTIQRPSRNAVSNPKAAKARRSYVLGRMLKLGYIDQATADAAAQEPVASRGYAQITDVEADYVAEFARQQVVDMFGEQAVNAGYTVYTTIQGNRQTAANFAERQGLLDYDQRHGYRGRLGKVDLSPAPETDELDDKLEDFRPVKLLLPAIVTKVAGNSAEVYIRDQGAAHIGWDDMSWASKAGRAAPTKAEDVVKRGDVVFVTSEGKGKARLAQLPEAQAALVALDPKDGAIVSLVGGFDFFTNAYNRAIQAQRQPGSGFKPFIYSAALDNGVTPATTFLNLPPVLDEGNDTEGKWRPQNDGGKISGPMRVREALVNSVNNVSIRLLQRIGLQAAIEHAARFGFDPETMPHDFTLALGTLSASPLQMATGYSVFANGGFKVDPYLITRIEDEHGNVVFEAHPKIACPACEDPLNPDSNSVPEELRAPRVLSAQNAWLMSDILHDVATVGTGRRTTQQLGRDDLAGKTGTTNDARDNWFNGFNCSLVASAWVGFDDQRSLGVSEEGSSTAVPLWIYFMREALKGLPSCRMERPAGIIDVTIDQDSGRLTDAFDPNGIHEYFIAEPAPEAIEGIAGEEGLDPATSAPPTPEPKPVPRPSGPPIF
jgi:penicillin-binding protein 1A